MSRILAIETSCDETAAAVVSFENRTYKNGLPKNMKMLSSVVASQIEIHKKTGGVVPEVAAREHVSFILPVIQKALKKAVVTEKNINAIATTTGPGLITALMVGVETAKTLALIWKKPLMSINHIEGHIAANFLFGQKIVFPAVVLVVSGGHSELIFMPKVGIYHLIGRTRDDAAGEAFDKIAKILSLGYPGGPVVAREARKGRKGKVIFPRPLMQEKTFDFSFAGLKTAVLYHVTQHPPKNRQDVADICYEAQEAITDVLVSKTIKVIEKYRAHSVWLAGGVAANESLRTRLTKETKKKGLVFFKPPFNLCTDNAAMIGLAATQHFVKKDFVSPIQGKVDPNWELV